MRRLSIVFILFVHMVYGQKIDRKSVVGRHNVKVSEVDTLGSLSVGNGRFAFTVDVTGLQTFPEYYHNGIPLGTQSEWGWHAWPNKENYQIEETIRTVKANGREVPYAVQWKEGRAKAAADFLRQNPHRLQLGNVGLELLKSDGSVAKPADLKNIRQQLDLWTGIITSYFELEGKNLEVETLSSQTTDKIAVKMKGSLLAAKQVKLRLRFPYPTDLFLDDGVNYNPAVDHSTTAVWKLTGRSAVITHDLRTFSYDLHLDSGVALGNPEQKKNELIYQLVASAPVWSFTIEFAPKEKKIIKTGFEQVKAESVAGWAAFWNSGGMVDFGKVTDSRGKEIERRMILSLYLTKIQCAGDMPPQETGLTQNSWFGKPHLEMAWWHGVHFAQWGRPEILENQMKFYLKTIGEARIIAQRQGFEGVRWQKMTDPDGKEAPSSVGAYLIWQQPHPIYFAELIYRAKPNAATIEKYRNMVYETADFMASYAYFDPELKRYILGRGVIAAQERFNPDETFNPTYELAYWHYALETAQQWRIRDKKGRNKKWDEVMDKLSPLPKLGNIYLAAESAPDSYTRPAYMTDHPSVLCALGMIPATKNMEAEVMNNTFEKIWTDWDWDDTWGWDFPMVAMTATRLQKPEKAVEALLMPIRTNNFLINGHNYQDKRLRLYLPANGGLLSAIALMTVGFDGSGINPGIPKNWEVKSEGMKKMP
jgi:hypothetical protein